MSILPKTLWAQSQIPLSSCCLPAGSQTAPQLQWSKRRPRKGSSVFARRVTALNHMACESRSSDSSTVAKSMVAIATVKHSLKIPDQLFLPLNANKKIRYGYNREWHSLLVGLWSILLIQSEISDENHQGHGKPLTQRKIKRIKNFSYRGDV